MAEFCSGPIVHNNIDHALAKVKLMPILVSWIVFKLLQLKLHNKTNLV